VKPQQVFFIEFFDLMIGLVSFCFSEEQKWLLLFWRIPKTQPSILVAMRGSNHVRTQADASGELAGRYRNPPPPVFLKRLWICQDVLKFFEFSNEPMSQIFSKISIVNEIRLLFGLIESVGEEGDMGFHVRWTAFLPNESDH